MRKVVLLMMITYAQLIVINPSKAADQKPCFNITGHVQGLKSGENLFLLVKRGNKVDTVSKTKTHNGVFNFKGVKLPVYPEFYLINVQTEFVEDLKLFLDQASDLTIEGDLKNWPNLSILGSTTHDEYVTAKNIIGKIWKDEFLAKYPDGMAPADSGMVYSLKSRLAVTDKIPSSKYIPAMIFMWEHPGVDAGLGLKINIDIKRSFYNRLSDVQKATHYGRLLAQQIKDYAIKKERIGHLKAAVQGLVSIANAEAIKQLSANTAAKIVVQSAAPSSAVLAEARLIEKLEQATVIVNMAFRQGEELLSNPTSAYVIDESGICVTNYHVGKEFSTKPYLSLSVMTKDGKSYPVTKILSCSESDDLMIFQVDTKGDKLTALPLGGKARKGTKIHVMGHPGGNFYHFTSGVISGYDAGSLAGKSCNTMSITAYFNVGSSGGPIVDDCGNIVGTVSRMTDSGERIGIPVSELKKLIEFKK